MPKIKRHPGASFLFALAAIVSGCAQGQADKVCFRGSCVKVEIADSDYKRQDGLMFRDSLPDNEGMLFVFEEEGVRGFWMMHMRFPLDIIWIGKNSRVAHIEKNVPPCPGPNDCRIIKPSGKAKYVLEVNSGFVDKCRLKLGDRLRIPAE